MMQCPSPSPYFSYLNNFYHYYYRMYSQNQMRYAWIPTNNPYNQQQVFQFPVPQPQQQFERMPMAPQQNTWRWRPTEQQRELFKEWKLFCIGYLVTTKEGINVRSISNYLEDHVGDPVPLQKMGFPSINHFLYEMADSIEVRTMDGFKIFVFIRDYAIPESMSHVRDMVMGQAKDKSCRGKRGDIRRPTKNQSLHASVDILIQNSQRRPSYNYQAQQYPNRPIVSPVYPRSNFNHPPRPVTYFGGGGMNSRPSNNYPLPSPGFQNAQRGSYYAPPRPSNTTSTSYRPPLPPARPVPVPDHVYDDWSDVVNQEPATKATPRRTSGGNYMRRFVPGIDDDDDDDMDEFGGFDYYAGENSFSKITVVSSGTTRSVELAKGSATAQKTGSTVNQAAASVGSSAPTQATPAYTSAQATKLSESVIPSPTPSKPVGSSTLAQPAPTKVTPVYFSTQTSKVSEAVVPIPSKPVGLLTLVVPTPAAAPPVYPCAQSTKLSESVASPPSKPFALPSSAQPTAAKAMPSLRSTTSSVSTQPPKYASLVPPSSESLVKKPAEAKKDPCLDTTDGKKNHKSNDSKKEDETSADGSREQNAGNTKKPSNYPGQIKFFYKVPTMDFPDLLRGGNQLKANTSLRSFLLGI